ncbi:unnamed protein product [Cuscuta epithymum]|uniref:Heat stress transcription factor n=1 Tax=Cuscuta epithymum TaxID=186058 RepID=A0AAV0DE56_9ASTE|nr:unnamed protein product [Cuscuta epithymum]
MMDGSQGGGGGCSAPAPFLMKTYELVEDPSSNHIVSWDPSGHSFVVWDPPKFCADMLPKYFKHNNFSSFIRQLNTYGFRKTDPERWEFANEEFIRGQTHLLKNIHRRKPIHSHSVSPVTDSERRGYEEEIEKLRNENASLQSQVEKHEKDNLEHKFEFCSLENRLKNIDRRQSQLVELVGQLAQNPTFASSLLHHLDDHNKRRKLLSLRFPSTTTTTSSISSDEDQNHSFLSSQNDLVADLDSSIDFCENLIHGIICDGNSSQDGCGTHSQTSSPSSFVINVETEQQPKKSSRIDMNTSPAESNSNREVDGSSSASVVANGGNDVFWQQFLTEAPGPGERFDRPEVESEKREGGGGEYTHLKI